MKNLSANKLRSVKWIIIFILIAFSFSIGGWGGDSIINKLTLVFIYMGMAQTWNLLSGFTGLTSLGQQAFFGIGGYVLAVTTAKFGWPIWTSFFLTIAVTLVFALVISIPIFKMSGVYFTIGTWIVAEALSTLFLNWEFVNYGIGYTVSAALTVSLVAKYIMAVALGVGSTLVLVLIMKSKMGMSLRAMRDNTSAAEVRGIGIYKTKLIVFLISAVIMALCGIVMYIVQVYVTPTGAFSMDWTIAVVFITIIGGSGTIEGPIVGAFVYVLLNQYLYRFPGYSNLILGIIAVVIIIVAPKGIMGYLGEKFNLDLFDIRRRSTRYGKRKAAATPAEDK